MCLREFCVLTLTWRFDAKWSSITISTTTIMAATTIGKELLLYHT